MDVDKTNRCLDLQRSQPPGHCLRRVTFASTATPAKAGAVFLRLWPIERVHKNVQNSIAQRLRPPGPLTVILP